MAHPCPAQVAVKLVFDKKDEGAPREMTTVTPKQWRTDFDREVAALRRIGLHPNCVAFYGVFDCDEPRGFQIRFNPTSTCAYSNGSDQTLWAPCFENSTRAIDASKNSAEIIDFDSTELERSQVWWGPPKPVVGIHTGDEFNARGVVLEFMSGGSLEARLKRGDDRRKTSVVDDGDLALADDVANGMSHLHGLGLMHRDLKPANVLVDARGVAKVSDFGLACVSGTLDDSGGDVAVGDLGLAPEAPAARDGSPRARHEHTGVTGTLRWMAPEVLEDRPYSFAADVYSYGVLLWQLLAWHPAPFEEFGTDVRGFASAVTRKGHRPSLEPCLDRAAPKALVDLIPRTWAADPAARPSFTDVIAVISATRAPPPADTGPTPSWPPRARQYKLGI